MFKEIKQEELCLLKNKKVFVRKESMRCKTRYGCFLETPKGYYFFCFKTEKMFKARDFKSFYLKEV